MMTRQATRLMARHRKWGDGYNLMTGRLRLRPDMARDRIEHMPRAVMRLRMWVAGHRWARQGSNLRQTALMGLSNGTRCGAFESRSGSFCPCASACQAVETHVFAASVGR